MTKIIFPKTAGQSNRLIFKLFNVSEGKKDKKRLNHEYIKTLLDESLGYIPKYEVAFQDYQGQYIIIENELTKQFIALTYENPEFSRNGYLITKVPLPFHDFCVDKTTKMKKFSIYLLDIPKDTYNEYEPQNPERAYEESTVDITTLNSKSLINDYQLFVYKLCKTLDITILNEDALPFKKHKDKKTKDGKFTYIGKEQKIKKPFTSSSVIKDSRLALMSKNSKNKSSYILESNDGMFVYAKTFGNNGFEITMITCALAKVAQKEGKSVYLYQLEDNGKPKPLTRKNRELLESFGVTIFEDIQDYENNPELTFDTKDCRNQAAFMKNLMFKYGKPGEEDTKRCYLCDCAIQKNIIASHTYPIAEINRLPLTIMEKIKMAIDGDNGFWLCASHDKLFEYGIITFHEETGELVLGQDYLNGEKLSEEDEEYIKSITKTWRIKPEHFNEKMKGYLRLHNDRIRMENLAKSE